MNNKMFAELVESIEQAGGIRRTRKMPASEDRTLDWSQAQKVVFPDLKPSTETISLRMPASLLHAIKREANRRDVPYQSLIKVVLADRFAAAKA
jgi:predicted DNA binding CopG/RHH family protein